ncbi:MAG: alpha/beta hydrolase [Gammaproteobacteria bacterium]
MKHLCLIILVISIHGCLPAAAADIKTHCLGQGPLVYLIGGGPAFTTWNLQPVQQTLSTDYRVCRWDMRGVGEQAGLPVKPEITALSQWIQDMHTVLPQAPVVLWGHSWGALQVLLFARQYPERVAALILSNPVDPALRSLEHIEQKRFNHAENGSRLKLEDMGTQLEAQHNLRSKIASYFADARQGWDYAAGFTQQDANNGLNIRIWDEYRQAPLTDDDMRQLADKISGAIYCQDDVLQPESLIEYKRFLDSTRHHVLTGCAHFPWEENPEAYYRALFGLFDMKTGAGG